MAHAFLYQFFFFISSANMFYIIIQYEHYMVTIQKIVCHALAHLQSIKVCENCGIQSAKMLMEIMPHKHVIIYGCCAIQWWKLQNKDFQITKIKFYSAQTPFYQLYYLHTSIIKAINNIIHYTNINYIETWLNML